MDIGKVYFKECRKRYAPLGFRRVGQTYARIVNDVMQVFTFKRYSSGRDCTVVFGVHPLCEELEYPELGLYNLCNFEVPTYYADWRYDRDLEISMEICVQLICGYIDRYLLPLFEEANCSEKALPALIKLDEHFQNVRQTHLLQHGFKDMAMDWRLRSLLDSEKFFMAVKCGQYEYAKKAAEVQIPNSIEEYQRLCRSIIKLIDEKDTAAIEKILTLREQQSLENLEKFRLKPMADS